MNSFEIVVDLGEAGEVDAIAFYRVEGENHPQTNDTPKEEEYVVIDQVTADIAGVEVELQHLIDLEPYCIDIQLSIGI